MDASVERGDAGGGGRRDFPDGVLRHGGGAAAGPKKDEASKNMERRRRRCPAITGRRFTGTATCTASTAGKRKGCSAALRGDEERQGALDEREFRLRLDDPGRRQPHHLERGRRFGAGEGESGCKYQELARRHGADEPAVPGAARGTSRRQAVRPRRQARAGVLEFERKSKRTTEAQRTQREEETQREKAVLFQMPHCPRANVFVLLCVSFPLCSPVPLWFVSSSSSSTATGGVAVVAVEAGGAVAAEIECDLRRPFRVVGGQGSGFLRCCRALAVARLLHVRASSCRRRRLSSWFMAVGRLDGAAGSLPAATFPVGISACQAGVGCLHRRTTPGQFLAMRSTGDVDF